MLSTRDNRLMLAGAALAVIGLAFAPYGCGGGNGGSSNTGSSTTSSRSYGSLRLQITWPAVSRAIPTPTTQIQVIITSLSGMFKEGIRQKVVTFDRSSPASTTENKDIPGIPAGDVSVDVVALDQDGKTIARAPSQLIRVQPGGTESFDAELKPLEFPIPNISSFTVDKTSILTGSESITATVKLNGDAPLEGADIPITSSDAPGSTLATVHIPYKAKENTAILTFPAADTTHDVTLTASYNTTPAPTQTVTLRALSVASFVVHADALIGGRQYTPATVTLSEKAPTSGVDVNINPLIFWSKFEDADAISPSSSTSIHFNEGEISKDFTVDTKRTGVYKDTSVRIDAKLGNTATVSSSFQVTTRHNTGLTCTKSGCHDATGKDPKDYNYGSYDKYTNRSVHISQQAVTAMLKPHGGR